MTDLWSWLRRGLLLRICAVHTFTSWTVARSKPRKRVADSIEWPFLEISKRSTIVLVLLWISDRFNYSCTEILGPFLRTGQFATLCFGDCLFFLVVENEASSKKYSYQSHVMKMSVKFILFTMVMLISIGSIVCADEYGNQVKPLSLLFFMFLFYVFDFFVFFKKKENDNNDDTNQNEGKAQVGHRRKSAPHHCLDYCMIFLLPETLRWGQC